MDPITHGLLGAAIARAVTPRGRASTALAGAAAGMLPDADVFFRPWTDPALPWEAHRHFTHALAFAPVGGLIALLPFLPFRRAREQFRLLFLAAVLAYASHGLLDACTSYGTRLYLPFSTARVSWDLIGIIDPVFSAILAAGLVLAWWFAARPAIGALLLCAAYLGVGAAQHAKAFAEVERAAAARGQAIEHARAMPEPGSLLVWRGLYVAQGRIWADGGRVPLLGAPRFHSGGSVEAFVAGADATTGDPRQARIADVAERFDRFCDGFAARDPGRPDVLADMRYSLGVADFEPLWGIRIDPSSASEPVVWVDLVTDQGAALRRLLKDLRGD